jgi:hypothetical protein
MGYEVWNWRSIKQIAAATKNGERLIKRRRRMRRKLKMTSVWFLQVWQRTKQAPGNLINIFKKYLKGIYQDM